MFGQSSKPGTTFCPYCGHEDIIEKFEVFLDANISREDSDTLEIRYDELSPTWKYTCVSCSHSFVWK